MRVSFVTYHAYALFDAGSPTPFGGAEVRATRFARGLATRRGFEISCLVNDEGQHPRQRFDGVEVLVGPEELRDADESRRRGWLDDVYLRFQASAERLDSFPWLRLHRWDANLLWCAPVLAANKAQRGLRAAAKRWWFRMWPPTPETTDFFARRRSDVVCAFGVNNCTARVVASCRKHGVRSVLFLASDHDLLDAYHYASQRLGPHYELGHYAWYALEHADRIVAQTSAQQQRLAERFGRESTLIRNPLPQPVAPTGRLPAADRFALWIGRAEHANKRPELCLDLARQCPEVPIVMIANRADREVFRQLQTDAPPNVRIIERVPFGEIDDYFRRAVALINTSRREGFPNTFLQAAGHGVPILSLLVDPDGFIAREGCGTVANDDVPSLAADLRRVWAEPEHARQLGQAGRQYVEANHALEGRIDELADLLQDTAEPPILRFPRKSSGRSWPWSRRRSERAA
jgi:glycosyltransferase involved in cell wall biosynthesis